MNRGVAWCGGVAALVVMAGAGVATAQWSSDPSSPMVVAGGAGDQAVPIFRPTIDGGAWITYMDNGPGGGYKPFVQRLQSTGVAAFGTPIQLANRTNTATFVYDMEVDAAGNAIIAFDDNSSGTTVATVHKVLPDGTLAWGATGLQMPLSTNALSPKISSCPDGSYICCWQITSGTSAVLYFQRINSDGTLGAAWQYSDTSDTGHYLAFSDIQPGGSGNEFIALWIRGHVYSATNSSKGLQIQKFGAGNTGLWNSGLPVDVAPYVRAPLTPTHSLQNGYFPTAVPDGNGGAVVGWYDIGTNRQFRFQHIQNDGTLRFGPDAFTAATTPGELQFNGTVDYDRTNDAFVMAFERSTSTQSAFGLGAQRVDASGTQMFGSAGVSILPTTGNHSAFIGAIAGPAQSMYVIWSQYQGASNPMEINATRLDSAGNPVWTPGIVSVTTTGTSKGRLNGFGVLGANRVVCGWNDGTSGANDVMAANINFDGTIGSPACPADLDGNGDINDGGNPDGGVDINDLLYFLAGFENGSPLVDLDNGSGTGTQDGGVDISDLLFFLSHFEAGC